MFSVTRPMMGVSREDESTVTTVSHGIRRPNGAYSALNFLGRTTPAVLSGNKLMGASASICRGGAFESGFGDGLMAAELVGATDGDFDSDSGLGTGGLNAANGRCTDCTTCGLPVMGKLSLAISSSVGSHAEAPQWFLQRVSPASFPRGTSTSAPQSLRCSGPTSGSGCCREYQFLASVRP